MRYLLIVIVLAVTVTSYAQDQNKRKTSQSKNLSKTQYGVDFLNYNYESSFCSQVYRKDGLPKIVKVRNGDFANNRVYFSISKDDIIYSGIRGDKRDTALVTASCGYNTANYYFIEIFFFELKNNRPRLLARLDESIFDRDYTRCYPKSHLWTAVKKITIDQDKVRIEKSADGPHCCPLYDVTLEYQWNGKQFSLSHKPEKRLKNPR